MKTGTVYWTNNIVVVSKAYTLCTCWTSNKTEARDYPLRSRILLEDCVAVSQEKCVG